MRGRFVARRLVMLLASLLVTSFVIFAALYLVPGTPLAALSGGQPLAAGQRPGRATF
jgi:peptide/nickel transport system permease protein